MSFLTAVPRIIQKDVMRLPAKVGKQGLRFVSTTANDGPDRSETPTNDTNTDDKNDDKYELIDSRKYISVTYLPYPDFDWEQNSTNNNCCFNIMSMTQNSLCKEQIGEAMKKRHVTAIRKVHSEATFSNNTLTPPTDPTADKTEVPNIAPTQVPKDVADIFAVYPLNQTSEEEAATFAKDTMNKSYEEVPETEDMIRSIYKIKSVDDTKLNLALRNRERMAMSSTPIVMPKLDDTMKAVLCFMNKQSEGNKKQAADNEKAKESQSRNKD